VFKGETLTVILNNKIIMIGRKDATGLYALEEEKIEEEEVNNINILNQWHERLGHLSIDQIKKLNEMTFADQ